MSLFLIEYAAKPCLYIFLCLIVKWKINWPYCTLTLSSAFYNYHLSGKGVDDLDLEPVRQQSSLSLQLKAAVRRS